MRTLNAAAEASTPAQAPADDGVRHAAWFAILAGTPRDTPMWPALFAGFELLSLIDHGIARPGWRRPGLHRSRDARAAVKLVRYHPAHPLLERVLQAIDRDSQSGITLVDALAAYASQLDGDGLRAVAEDVYETAARVGYARHVPGMAARVYVGWARCRRELDRCQDADATIAAGLDLARQADDVITELTLQISHACLAMHQGCFETAATRLDEVLARAAALDLPEIEAIASHDRGVCAHELGRPARALEYYERAFLHHATPAGRMRVINDIGRAFAELDHHDQPQHYSCNRDPDARRSGCMVPNQPPHVARYAHGS